MERLRSTAALLPPHAGCGQQPAPNCQTPPQWNNVPASAMLLLPLSMMRRCLPPKEAQLAVRRKRCCRWGCWVLPPAPLP